MRTLRISLLAIAAIASALAGCSSSPAALSPEETTHLTLQVTGARHDFESANPTLKAYFDTAKGYAIFPRVTSIAVGIGGAGGHGQVFENGKLVGVCDVSQGNVGASLGGQRYAEVLFFQNESSLAAFKSGDLNFDARASAIAASAGKGTAVDYENGVRVFSLPESGLMFQAAIGGQRFRFWPASR